MYCRGELVLSNGANHYIYASFFFQALINSTITANMNFTKTSPKFGQWSDHRANTVYGLGFSAERDLAQVLTEIPPLVVGEASSCSRQSSGACALKVEGREWLVLGLSGCVYVFIRSRASVF